MKKVFPITAEEYKHLRDIVYGGICIECGRIIEDAIEPEAENCKCIFCGQNGVFGIEDAFFMGRLSIPFQPSDIKPANNN